MRRYARWTITMAAAVLLMSLSGLAISGPAQDPAAPDKPPLAHLRAYVEAFNSSVQGTMRAFFASRFSDAALKEIPVEQRLTRFRSAKARIKDLTIDLGGVEMIDSVGLGVLIATHNSLRQAGGQLAVANPSPDVQSLLRTMRLDKHFKVLVGQKETCHG